MGHTIIQEVIHIILRRAAPTLLGLRIIFRVGILNCLVLIAMGKILEQEPVQRDWHV